MKRRKFVRYLNKKGCELYKRRWQPRHNRISDQLYKKKGFGNTKSKIMSEEIKKHIDIEVELAEKCVAKNDLDAAFQHLERSHILGQSITYEHTRVHWLMLKIGWKRKDLREIFGQIFRILGASTKTPFGIYPTGNTGGANVSPFKPMPIAEDLQMILRRVEK